MRLCVIHTVPATKPNVTPKDVEENRVAFPKLLQARKAKAPQQNRKENRVPLMDRNDENGRNHTERDYKPTIGAQ